MKGISQGIPSYLYVLVTLIVAVIMLTMVFRYSDIFIPEKTSVTIIGDERSISKDLAKIIQDCWEDNRRGLEDESSICKQINFGENLKVEEINVTKYLDCDKLPNSNCYIYPGTSSEYDCSECSSEYFGDTDKILWFSEKENTRIKVNYLGGSRKIVITGSICDGRCMCERDCKRKCIDGLNPSYCEKCYDDCDHGITATTSTTIRGTTTSISVTTSSITTTTIRTPQWSQCFNPNWVLGETCMDLCEEIGKECVSNGCGGYGIACYNDGCNSDGNCGSVSSFNQFWASCDIECAWSGHRDSCKCCCR